MKKDKRTLTVYVCLHCGFRSIPWLCCGLPTRTIPRHPMTASVSHVFCRLLSVSILTTIYCCGCCCSVAADGVVFVGGACDHRHRRHWSRRCWGSSSFVHLISFQTESIHSSAEDMVFHLAPIVFYRFDWLNMLK